MHSVHLIFVPLLNCGAAIDIAFSVGVAAVGVLQFFGNAAAVGTGAAVN